VGFEVRVWWGGVFGNLEEKKELLREAMATMQCNAVDVSTSSTIFNNSFSGSSVPFSFSLLSFGS